MSGALQEFTSAGGELAKLVTSDWLGRVTHGIEKTIRLSFETDQVLRPVMTKNEIEHRFRICIKWFVTLRRDLHWSIPRILDDLPKALRHELDGTPYAPDEHRAGWMTGTIRPFDISEIGDEDLAGPLAELNDAVEVEGIGED